MYKSRPTPAQLAERFSLLFALLLVLLIAALSYRGWVQFGRSNDQLARSQDISAETDALLAAVTDAETGQRGFLLTGRDGYLQPYQQALSEVPTRLQRLRNLTAGTPEEAERVQYLESLVDEKVAELRRTIELRRSKGSGAALNEVLTDRGKTLMDEVRRSCGEVEAMSNSRLRRESAAAKTGANDIGFVSTVGSACLFVLLILATITIQRARERREQLIGQLQRSEAQTTIARDFLQTTLRSIGDGVIATDAAGHVTFLNPIAESITGWTQAETAGRPLEEIFVIHNEYTNAAVENPVSKALREGRVVGLANHTVLTAKDGRKVPIDDSAAPIRAPGGNIEGVVMVFRDVTERRRTEVALAERAAIASLAADVGAGLTKISDLSQALQHCAHAIVEHLDAAFARIWTLNARTDVLELQASAGLYTHLNGAHSRIPVGSYKIGRIAQQRQPHLTDDVLSDADISDPEWAKREGMVAFGGYPLVVEDQVVGVLGVFARHALPEHTLKALSLIADTIAIGIQRKLHEEALRRQAEALERSNADLQQFAFAASHDLQEPLRIVATYSQLLVSRVRDALNKETQVYVNFITEGTKRMGDLLGDLLAYTRLNYDAERAPSFIDLNDVLQEVTENLKASVEESKAAIVSDRLPVVYGYESHFVQLLQNLISNAIKYRGQSLPQIHVSAAQQKGMWTLAVRDNGIGISPQYHQTIFGVFKRLHGKEIAGTGIGLAICQRVVERYGGRIWVESQPGNGSTFCCTLPTAREQQIAASTAVQ